MRLLKSVLLCLFVFSLWGCEKKASLEGSGAGGGAVEMQIWTTENKSFLESFALEFIASQGTSNLRFKVVEFETEKLLQDFLLEKLADGEGPDIVYIDGDWITHNHKKLKPYSAKEDNGFNAENFRLTFVPVVNELLLEDNLIYGVPLGVETLGIFFNKEHVFSRLPDRNTPGRYWTQFKKDVESLTKTDNSFQRFYVSGAALGRTDNTLYGAEVLENIILQMGGRIFDVSGSQVLLDKFQIQDENGKNQNIGEKALLFFTSFADSRFKHYAWNQFLVNEKSNHKDFEAFVLGKTSMVFGYPQDWERIKQLLEANASKKVIDQRSIGVAPFPQIEDITKSSVHKLVGKVKALAIVKSTKYPNTAWKFLQFMVKKKNLTLWNKASNQPTPRLDMLIEQRDDPEFGIFVRQSKFARSNKMPLSKDYFYDPIKSIIPLINNGISVSEGLKVLTNRIQEIFNTQVRKKQKI